MNLFFFPRLKRGLAGLVCPSPFNQCHAAANLTSPPPPIHPSTLSLSHPSQQPPPPEASRWACLFLRRQRRLKASPLVLCCSAQMFRHHHHHRCRHHRRPHHRLRLLCITASGRRPPRIPLPASQHVHYNEFLLNAIVPARRPTISAS